MKALIPFLLLVSTTSFLLISHTHSSEPLASISGRVVDQNQEGVPFANVLVFDTNQVHQIAGVATDFDGYFKIDSLLPGIYTVSASYVGKTVNITGIELVSGQSFEMDTIVINTAQHLQMLEVKVSAPTPSRQAMAGVTHYNMSPMHAAPAAAFNREAYSHIAENEFHDSKNKPLSTFSIDVDRASYSNIRRLLNEGTLPPEGAIRVEEMVNYFDYDYPEPSGNDPFSITTELGACPWNQKHKLALIGLKSEKVKTQDLPPNNLVFLLDVSGSMQSYNKLPLVKKSMRLLVQNLRQEDQISIVVYAGAAGLVLPPTMGNEKEVILNAIDQLEANGSTAGGAGLKLAYEMASKHLFKDGNNRVILATDGDFNVGLSSESQLVQLIKEKRETGVYLTVLGFGTGNLQDSKMEQLADHGNGNYSYIDNLLEGHKVLVQEMGGTLLTVAKDVKIQVEFNPDRVQAYRLVGYENRMLDEEDFNNDRKDAGEIGAGHQVTALYEVIPTGVESGFSPTPVDTLKYQTKRDASGSNEWLTVKVRYKPPAKNKSILMSHVLPDPTVATETENLIFASSVAGFGMLLRQSDFIDDLTYDDVIALATSSKGDDADGYRSELIRLVALARILDKALSSKE